MLDEAQVAVILEEQKADGLRFCSTALRLGMAPERSLVKALSRQRGTPGMVVDELSSDRGGRELVPQALAEARFVLPARVFTRTLTLLMRDPEDDDALSAVQQASARVVRPMVALEGPLREAIEKFYSAADPSPVPRSPSPRPEKPSVPVAPLPPEQVVPLDEAVPESVADPALVAQLAPGFDGGRLSDGGALPAQLEPTDRSEDADPRPVVLAVDDETTILRLYEGMLDPEKYRLETCERGDEALEMVRRHRPAVVLLDALLPGLHGFEVCRRIKQHDTLGGTGVILLSAAYRGWQMKADLMRQYGADDFIEKPFDIGYLLEQVGRLVAEGKGRRNSARPLFAEALRHLNQGLLLMQKGDLEEAAAAFRKSIEADPFAARPHFYLGKIHERSEARFEAMFEYEQAVSLDASFFPAIKDLAILYQSNGFVNKAVEMWQQALAACPEASMRNAIREHLVRLL